MLVKILDTNGDETTSTPLETSAGAGDQGKLVGLDASGKINQNMMPTGVGPELVSFVVGSTVAAGDLVNFYDDAGTAKIRRADASNGRVANGFVKTGATSGSIDVYMDGTISGMSGLTAGTRYYLSGSPGQVTATAPVTSGSRVQYVGTAVNATSLSFVRAAATLVAA